MIDAKLLEVRKSVKRRKPNFQIQNSNDPVKRFAGRWKRPKGLQNKMRENRKGNPISIEPGYGSPAAVRGAAMEGVFPFVVCNVEDLAKAPEGYGIVISAGVGMRKKVEIVKAATAKKLMLLNFKAEEISKRIDDALAARKKRRQEILHKRKTKAESKKPAPATSPEQPAAQVTEKSDEEKKKAEKEEKDKLLTKAK
jgi:large subunit ribosomal protein L32e